MRGLGLEIEKSLVTIIEGLNYNLFPDGDAGYLDSEKMKIIMNSKVSSFNSAKKILNKWMNSPNAPSRDKSVDFIESIIGAGESAIGDLRKALAEEIDYDELDKHKFDAAIKAKPVILEAIFDLDYSLHELREKLEGEDISLDDKDFKLGYPERFSRGDFYPISDYYKDWLNETNGSIKICPFGTEGELIELDNLNIQLPEVPDKSEILYYDLPEEEQYWRRIEIPRGITPDNVDLWDDHIRGEFKRRREGVWFMNKGKPTYLTGSHYFSLQYCKMLDNGGYMDFRIAQQNIYYFAEACIIDRRSLGMHFTKSRRTGFTYAILFIMLNHATGTRNNMFGMTSKSDTDASKAFLKFRYALMNLPFYFRPVIYGKLDSTKQFNFSAPVSNTKEAKKGKAQFNDDYLNNTIDYQPTKTDSYDGQAMYMYLGDESGKWVKPNDYVEHWGTISPTMLEGGMVVGKAFIGSTVGAMSKGGEQFKQLYDASDVEKRNDITGMTSSGLYRYFLPAQENMTAFTDKYGVCHQEKPTDKIYNVNGGIIRVGSTDFLLSQEEAAKSENDTALNAQYRAFPRTIEHAFRDEADQCVFNMEKLYEQIDHNDKLPQESKYVVGNFEWVGGIVDGDVEFHPNPKGRFKVAWMPSKVDNTEHLQNRVRRQGDNFYPLNDNHVRFGCDPFSYKSTHGEGSKGALHGKTMLIPSDGIPKNLFVVEYIARPSDEVIFFEDVIKCIRFYGAPILVESNRLDLLRHMYNRGYRGFAMNRLDRPKSKLNANELKFGGQMMSGQDILDSHIGAIGTWVQDNVGTYFDKIKKLRKIGEMGEMVFNDTLKEWLKFDPDKRTKFDAVISSGLAIMACQSEKYRGKKTETKKIDLSSILTKYSTKGATGQKIR